MKLSKKGKSRIHEMIDCAFEAHPDDAKGVQVLAKKYLTECDDFELEPDDFEGTVCLTVEEAKALLFMSGIFSIEHYTPDQNKELLNNLYRQLLRQDFDSTKKYFECFRKNEHFRNEWKRIEKVEKGNETK